MRLVIFEEGEYSDSRYYPYYVPDDFDLQKVAAEYTEWRKDNWHPGLTEWLEKVHPEAKNADIETAWVSGY